MIISFIGHTCVFLLRHGQMSNAVEKVAPDDFPFTKTSVIFKENHTK